MRSDTINQEAWRTQHIRPDGSVMCEWNKRLEAEWWYENVTLTPGYKIRIQHRPTGEQRFKTIKERWSNVT